MRQASGNWDLHEVIQGLHMDCTSSDPGAESQIVRCWRQDSHIGFQSVTVKGVKVNLHLNKRGRAKGILGLYRYLHPPNCFNNLYIDIFFTTL